MKKKYTEMTLPERQAEYAALQAEFEGAKALHLALNMARGKPGREQLDMVTPIFGLLTESEQFMSDGVETRNYGEVAGIPAARRLFADILGCQPEQVFVGGNASLQLMYDAVSKAPTVCSTAKSPGASWTRSSGSAPFPAMTATSRSPRASAWR